LTLHIPQIRDDIPFPITTTPPIPTTKDHTPFILPIPKPLVDLYQLGDANTQSALEKASDYLQEHTSSNDTTTTHIDKAAKYGITMMNTYHKHAQTIWQMAQQTPPMEPQQLRPPITKSEIRQIHRLTKLRNSARWQQQAKP
jgi:hypothetical protein